jgi:hypothetical protein
MGVGAGLEGTSSVIGRPILWKYAVTTFVPPTSFGGSMRSGTFDFAELYTLESLGVSTRVRQRTHVQPHGLFKLLEPLMAVAIRRLLTADFGRLKRRLESSRAA